MIHEIVKWITAILLIAMSIFIFVMQWDEAQSAPRCFDYEIKYLAEKHGMPWKFVRRLIWVENPRCTTRIRGKHGEYGLMQIKCATARTVGLRDKCKVLYRPSVNLKYGIRFLAKAWRKANGDAQLAAGFYNSGINRPRPAIMSGPYMRRFRRKY